MADFTRTDMGTGILTPCGIRWRDQDAEYPPASGNGPGASILAELDAVKDDIVAHIGTTGTIHRNRRMPEGAGIWVNMSTASTTAGFNIPDDTTMWGLKNRGVVPVIQIDAPVPRMSAVSGPATGRYQGAPVNGPARGTAIGSIPGWSASNNTRNFAQRVLDGDYDAWMDAFATRCADYVGLVNPATGEPNPPKNLKGEAFDDYDAIIVRPWFEMNGRVLNQSCPWVDDANRGRRKGVLEFIAAWCHLVDRVRATAPNVHFFWCFGFTNEEFRRNPINYLPEHHGQGPGTNDELRERIQFVGLDTYNSGRGTQGHLLMGDDASDAPGRRYLQIFEDFGGTDKPGLIGEYGIAYGHQNGSVCEGNTAHRVWENAGGVDCGVEGGTTDWNDRCRGRWIRDSFMDVRDKRAGGQGDRNKWQALKGMFYMAADLSFDSCWGLWQDTGTTYGSFPGQKGCGSPTGDPWTEPDPESRPVLGDGISGSDRRGYARWATLQQSSQPWGTVFSGRGGAFFKR